ncbi:hypothetical protein LCGC14_2153310, partial [marine sediment metagenome]
KSKSKSKFKSNKESNKRKTYGEFKNVLLTDKDYKKLVDKFGEVKTKKLIEKLSEGIERKNYKYKNFYLAILDWERRDAGAHREHPRAVLKPGDYTEPGDVGR